MRDIYLDLVGQYIDHYYIVRRLARGAAASVFLARDEKAIEYQEVALKVTALAYDDPTGMIQRLDYEVSALRQLSHPNIIKVLGFGQVGPYFYIAMEYIPGGTFRQEIARCRSIEEYCREGIQVARALDYAHNHQVIHRDIKPQNILVDDRVTPYRMVLTDFGIARVLGMLSITLTGDRVGTPQYMAPEQAKGEKDLGRQVDIYALGCVLYHAFAKRPPFEGDDAAALWYQHIHDDPPPLRQINPDVPEELASIIEQTMAKKPRARFGTAKALAVALNTFLRKGKPHG